MKVAFILSTGKKVDVEADVGTSVMETAVMNNIRGIDGECGGCCSCATCHVYVDESFTDRLSAPDVSELELLEGVASEKRNTSRLGCQIVLTDALDGLVIHIPERQG